MTGELWPSAWVAAVFAVHPLHVESVAWIAERRDMLSGLFFMLTLAAYARYAERPSLPRNLTVVLLFALGLMSKAILIPLPCILLLLDYWPLGRFGRGVSAWRLVWEKTPLFALSAASCMIVMSTHSVDFSLNPAFDLPLSVRLSNVLVSYAAYVGQSFWPVNIIIYYPFRTDLALAWVAGSLTMLVAVTALALYCWRSRPYLLVGWLWFLVMLAPVSGIMPVGSVGHARADRYTYLSQIGLAIAVAWLVWRFYLSRQSLENAVWQRWVLAVLSSATLLALAVVAWRQTTFWRDDETLWTHTVECDPRNWLGLGKLTSIQAKQGKTEETIAGLRESLKSDAIEPAGRALYHMLLADLLVKQGKVDEAITNYEETVRLFPTGERGHTQLAAALAAAGRLDEAIAQWREAIRMVPERWSSHLGLADAMLAAGDPAAAAAECAEILEHEPRAIDAAVTLGMALSAQGKTAEALACLKQASSLDPRHSRAQFQLGLALGELGRSEDALVHLNEAIRLQPDSVPMLWHTAWILATDPDPLLREGARAVELAKEAVELSKGQDLQALDALAAALAETGQFSAAADVAWQASMTAMAQSKVDLSAALAGRVRLYRQQLPYRQPPKAAGQQESPSGEAPADAAK
jgi:tetratricopeptide (TPR) repeat protein